MSDTKDWVKARYAAIAEGSRKPCCGEPTPNLAERIGYRPDDLAAAPEAADLSLGCGNPLALAAILPGQTVLDLGCGAGFDALLAAARVGPAGRVIGVDMTPEMIQQARANAARAGCSNADFRLGDIESLPVEDASVDLVISNCVLVLVPDKPKAFREIARVLKPGGAIAIADIVLDGPLPEALKGDPDAYCSCVSGALPRPDYLAAIEAAGLEDVRLVAEADAAELLASDCCGAGLTVSDLTGLVTSIQVAARKPPSGGAP